MVSKALAKRRRDGNALAALSWIRAQAQDLMLGAHGRKSIVEYVTESPEMVLDFSEIKNERAQSFYAEVILRELYSSHTAELVVFGELLKRGFQVYLLLLLAMSNFI